MSVNYRILLRERSELAIYLTLLLAWEESSGPFARQAGSSGPRGEGYLKLGGFVWSASRGIPQIRRLRLVRE